MHICTVLGNNIFASNILQYITRIDLVVVACCSLYTIILQSLKKLNISTSKTNGSSFKSSNKFDITNNNFDHILSRFWSKLIKLHFLKQNDARLIQIWAWMKLIICIYPWSLEDILLIQWLGPDIIIFARHQNISAVRSQVNRYTSI